MKMQARSAKQSHKCVRQRDRSCSQLWGSNKWQQSSTLLKVKKVTFLCWESNEHWLNPFVIQPSHSGQKFNRGFDFGNHIKYSSDAEVQYYFFFGGGFCDSGSSIADSSCPHVSWVPLRKTLRVLLMIGHWINYSTSHGQASPLHAVCWICSPLKWQ